MAIKWVEPLGKVLPANRLKLSKAKELALFLASNANPYAKLIETRRTDSDAEVVLLEVEVELGQIQRHPIESVERLEVLFFKGDRDMPEVLALREDFPSVPHLNLRPFSIPRSLCLYEEKYVELKRSWTASVFVERIRTWLALTAKGKLHGDDQPLEALIESSVFTISVPRELITEPAKPLESVVVRYLSENKSEGLFIAERVDASYKNTGIASVAAIFTTEPKTHGVIQHKPNNLSELNALVQKAGLDLNGELRKRLAFWNNNNRNLLKSPLIIILTFPKTRVDGGKIEAVDVRAFLIGKPLAEIGVDLGLWGIQNGQIGVLIPADATKTGAATEVEIVNVVYNFSRAGAAELNGVKPNDRKILAVGAGALGSQVILNLLRGGFGEWSVVDKDFLFPHNLARHSLERFFVGKKKAKSLQAVANSLYEKALPSAMETDFLNPSDKKELDRILSKASVITDFSASLAVARHLAYGLDRESMARRLSMFLNPRGTDMVILAEDTHRKVRLDVLEMQYYRAIASSESLKGHLQRQHGRIRYAQSCRDISSDVPQDYVATLAGIGARGVRKAVAVDNESATVWRINEEDLTVSSVRISTSQPVFFSAGIWTVCTDQILLDKLFQLRTSKLPNETGGVLLGSYDMERRFVYIFDTTPSPPDSEEWPTVYVRGCEGLAAKVNEVAEETAGMLQYIGEWHSHPDNCSCRPSGTDKKAFSELIGFRVRDGMPALMMIVGQNQAFKLFIGEMK